MGVNTPKIRFDGFTDAWEQRKFGDVIEQSFDKNTDLQYGVTDAIGVTLTKEMIPTYANISEDTDVSGFYLVNPNCFVYNPRTHGKKIGVGLNTSNRTYIVTFNDTVFKVKNSQADEKFLLVYMSREQWDKEACSISLGTSTIVLKWNVLCDMSFLAPSIEEQRKISELLVNLDNLITFHQRKCDEMKELKKYMLQKMFPREGQTVPEIRFSGFTDAWEQRKLKDIAVKVTEKNSDLIVRETFTNSAEYGVISQRDFFDHDITNSENIGGYYMVRDEDFVYNPRISATAPVGPVNRNKLGRTGVMSPLYTVFRTHDVNTTYLEWFFKSSYWHSFMYFNGDSGARSDRFSIKDAIFFEMPIPMPSIDEQYRIGMLMDKLDNFITLHQRKCDEMKELKKFMLQKMFPEKG